MQRTIQLEHHGTRCLERCKSHVGAGPQQMLLGNHLRFDAIIGDVETTRRRRGGRLLRRGRDAQEQRGRQSQTMGKAEPNLHGILGNKFNDYTSR